MLHHHSSWDDHVTFQCKPQIQTVLNQQCYHININIVINIMTALETDTHIAHYIKKFMA